MKRFLAFVVFLLLANVGLAQSARWRFVVPAPAYPADVTYAALLANDGLGGSVFILTDYRDAPEITAGALVKLGERILWIDRRGKLLHTMARPFLPETSVEVAAISPSVLHLRTRDAGGTTIAFRRIVRTAKSVAFKDITPAPNEMVAEGPAFVGTADSRGYFTFKYEVRFFDKEHVTEIVRYGP